MRHLEDAPCLLIQWIRYQRLQQDLLIYTTRHSKNEKKGMRLTEPVAIAQGRDCFRRVVHYFDIEVAGWVYSAVVIDSHRPEHRAFTRSSILRANVDIALRDDDN